MPIETKKGIGKGLSARAGSYSGGEEKLRGKFFLDRELSTLLWEKEILAPYTTFKIGGSADLFFRAKKIEELVSAVLKASELKIPYFILGGGSNILISDEGFKGLVIRNECRKVNVVENKIVCQSGAWLDDLVSVAGDNSLAGLEFCAGIPGTVGGAVYGNAGAYGKWIGEFLKEAVILTADGKTEIVDQDYFGFDYRYSHLKKKKDILLSAEFELKKGDNKKIKKEVQRILAERKRKLPEKESSAGCFFKNIKSKNLSAGSLLDEVGAKHLSVGEAAVFSKHANIIINRGNAKAKDVKKLARILRDRVKDKFGIDLQEEVIYVS
jgi:UDP-N-acetylmuramate dehydrogenase